MSIETDRQGKFRDDVIDTLARLDTKMNQILEKDADKEKRLRSLERWKWSHAISGTAFALVLAKLGIPLPGTGP